jgi:hypothetical protein
MMGFHISFTARSAYAAKKKLASFDAPAVVKALIETAIDALPAPKPPEPQRLFSGEFLSSGKAADPGQVADPNNPPPPDTGQAADSRQAYASILDAYHPRRQDVESPQTRHLVLGVLVEAWGHIADAGSGGTSHIERFVVRPLID